MSSTIRISEDTKDLLEEVNNDDETFVETIEQALKLKRKREYAQDFQESYDALSDEEIEELRVWN